MAKSIGNLPVVVKDSSGKEYKAELNKKGNLIIKGFGLHNFTELYIGKEFSIHSDIKKSDENNQDNLKDIKVFSYKELESIKEKYGQ